MISYHDCIPRYNLKFKSLVVAWVLVDEFSYFVHVDGFDLKCDLWAKKGETNLVLCGIGTSIVFHSIIALLYIRRY